MKSYTVYHSFPQFSTVAEHPQSTTTLTPPPIGGVSSVELWMAESVVKIFHSSTLPQFASEEVI